MLNPTVSIIIPYYKNKDTIKELLASVYDQDYKDFEVIVVLDGESREDEDLLVESQATAHPFILKMLSKNSGASAARNFGAKGALGNILFFIDADCRLYPGVLRACIDELKDQDIDFVYGHYRFGKTLEYHAIPFNKEQLSTMNYISTMSPVRRKAFEAVGGFKEHQPFFQDWSLFYRLASGGYKGKLLNEFIFTTKESTEISISGSQGLTLAQKAAIFRAEHGIEDKILVATTFGAPTQAIHRAKVLGADYVGMYPGSKRQAFPCNLAFDNWKATYMTGVYNEPLDALKNHLTAVVGHPILHFIGTDVYQLMTGHSVVGLKAIVRALREYNASIFANAPRLVAELAEVGIKADLLYTPIVNAEKFSFKPDFPKKFTVAVYYSDTPNLNFFSLEAIDQNLKGTSNVPLLYDVAMSMPNVEFKFFGGRIKYTKDNIEFCGKIPEDDMPAFIGKCSAIVRSTVHDGFPQLPLQFMFCGRDALVSCPEETFKYADKLSFEAVENYMEAKNEIITKIMDMKRRARKTEAETEAIRSYYYELMSEKVFKETIYKAIPRRNDDVSLSIARGTNEGSGDSIMRDPS